MVLSTLFPVGRIYTISEGFALKQVHRSVYGITSTVWKIMKKSLAVNDDFLFFIECLYQIFFKSTVYEIASKLKVP